MSSLAHDSYLPSEILLVIFDNLDDNDLYQLINVSPRFYHLSLLAYFAKRKVIIFPDGHVDLRNRIQTRRMLPFLRKARFITSFNHFSCAFMHPHKSLLEDISNLTAILMNVEKVEVFDMEILRAADNWTSAMIKQVNADNALSNAFNELLTAAGRVSRTVAVKHGTSFSNVLQKANRGNGRIRWSLGPVTRLFSSDKSKKRSSIATTIDAVSSSPTSISSSPSTRGNLHTFVANSIVLLSPPFLEWTIQTLNSNVVTTLSVGNVEFRAVHWSSLLSRIDIPALETLDFRSQVPFGTLVDFMSRHKGITALTVYNVDLGDWNNGSTSTSTTFVGEPSDEISVKLKKAFANITRLTCYPQGLSYLLSRVLHPANSTVDLFPNVRFISVIMSLGIGQQLNMSVVKNMLAPLVCKLRSCERVDFKVIYRSDVGSSWQTPAPPTPVQGSIGLASHPFSFANSGNSTLIGQIPVNPNPGNMVSNEPPASPLSAFTEIKLEITDNADMEGIPALTRSLADAFTAIKNFKVDSSGRRAHLLRETQVLKLMLCHHILKRFQQLGVVQVDETYWKRSEQKA